MRAPDFWWRAPGPAAAALTPLAMLYGAVASRRLAQGGARAAVPVICIGNLTVGGAGKTPTAIAVARLLIAAGERPVFLTRGHGGELSGPLQVDPVAHTARQVGDEPLLLARVAPTVVARDRPAGARTAVWAGASIIVMDDGFQNPSLTKDLSILVVDGGHGIGNGRVFPAGPLRAPLGPQLARAQAMLVIGEPEGATPAIAAAQKRSLPVLHGRLAPDQNVVATLRSAPALAFAGIGDPEKFFATLAAAGIAAPARRAFPDHHRYRADEATALIAEAERHGLTLVTTEKDLMRLVGDPALAGLAERARALPVELETDAALRDLVLGAVRA